MTQRYAPMLTQRADVPFDSDDWIFEIKWDGIRAISYIDSEFSVRSRNNKELLYNFPELYELRGLAKDIVIDGEIVVMKEGRANFQALLERVETTSSRDIEYMTRESPATYVVFDILEKDGVSLLEIPLMERKTILREHLKEGKHIVVSTFIEGDGKSFYQAALDKGIEGIIAKKKVSMYQPGVRSSNWLKIKEILSCDCAIFGFTRGEGNRRETFGALILGLYDGGKPVFVGKVGTGFSQTETELLMNSFQDLKVNEATLEHVDVREKITWLRPELVYEVVYQNVTKDGKLRMPRYRGLRTDKIPIECTLDQIRPVKLQEYISKRDFTATPEPEGGVRKEEERTFVVQEHHARRLHYDLRLEKDGVLKSWAVPKGFPEKLGEKRLAIETEDHPVEYSTFEGTIPPGQYGAGTVKIWDRGSYDLKVWDNEKIEFILRGEKLRGRYVLARFKRAGEKEWVLLEAKD